MTKKGRRRRERGKETDDKKVYQRRRERSMKGRRKERPWGREDVEMVRGRVRWGRTRQDKREEVSG